MKTSRKGFTLVELLIVVAILATLTATMTYSVSGSTAKAKAAAIANNVNAAETAVSLYMVNNAGDALNEMTTDEVLRAAMPTWADFGDTSATTPIKYQAVNTSDKGPANWAIKVDFSGDGEKDAIKTALQAIKGYNKYWNGTALADVMPGAVEAQEAVGQEGQDGYQPAVLAADAKYEFKVMLTSGKILPTD